ncbi:asparagine synthase-related protein [Snuella sedimenti]|uniref:asparagine synthase (glutamine-hydrolyzing) n=1 Tax=Snuella sedimenti TaxID=2798802 RepID=A0A8J7JB85_9FLAO|nr:asparagine synthase-related protein [Snuella sedimenti]MBJ6367909.1 asparagine synthetase B family protein [Snuella sedimenti]
MKTITIPIIPTNQTFAKVHGPHELHLEAICVFAAIGFFLDGDTYWKDQVVLRPASKHTLDTEGKLLRSEPYFKWHHSPKTMSFDTALEGYMSLFEQIIADQTEGKQIILPLSGGLDSRTQAVALQGRKDCVFAYSYAFENGYAETKIARQVAKICGFEFRDYVVPKGYLWSVIDDLSKINGCYSDFTSPRQMAVVNSLKDKGDVFSLGHWGDVLFDSMGLPKLSKSEQVDVLMGKLLKRGGLELAQTLWELWGLQGHFTDYFRSRITDLLSNIDIEDTNAKLRAFKSMYWAPRWTSVNLAVFEANKAISLPYYDNRMCEFICALPEKYLKGRKLQIAYIKRKAPELAKITWQDQRPFHLYNYHLNRLPYNLPYRALNKIRRTIKMSVGVPYIQRNWELQFLGKPNQAHLLNRMESPRFYDLVPKAIVRQYTHKFYNENALQYAHSINMLLVLSQFYKNQVHGEAY